MQVAPDIIAEYTRQTGDQNKDSIKKNGLFTAPAKVVNASCDQAFFTLSLGIGAMEIFGSYMPNGRTLTGESVRICGLDTFVALMSGLIIFPACFSFGIQPDAPGCVLPAR